MTALLRVIIFQIFAFLLKEEQGWSQNQEEGWEVQDGSAHVRRIGGWNSGKPLTVEERKEEGGDKGM